MKKVKVGVNGFGVIGKKGLQMLYSRRKIWNCQVYATW